MRGGAPVQQRRATRAAAAQLLQLVSVCAAVLGLSLIIVAVAHQQHQSSISVGPTSSVAESRRATADGALDDKRQSTARVQPLGVSSAPAVAPPIAIRIPNIGAVSRVVALGRNADGSVQVPSTAAAAGWYRGSPSPGAVGPAVILGHVDSRRGPGVFFRLASLQPTNRIYLHRADGTSVAFIVYDVRQYSKDRFPTAAVYGDTRRPELRLITCGGSFDRRHHTYRDNVVVYAALA